MDEESEKNYVEQTTKVKKSFIEQIKESNVYSWQVVIVACNLAFPLFMGQNIGLISYDFNIQEHFAASHGFNGTRVPTVNWAIANAAFPVFGMVGSFTMSWAVDKYGRKYTSIFCICVGILGEIFLLISYFAGRLELLGISRALVGYSSAGGMVAGLCMLFENLPGCYKIIFNPLVQVFINLGIFISGILTLDNVSGKTWVYIVIPPLIVAILYLCVLIYLPESVVYLSQKNRVEELRKSLKKYRKDKGALLENELETLMAESMKKNEASILTVKDLFKTKRFTTPVIVCLFIHVSQQISGINAIIAYVGTFFLDSSFNQPDIAGLTVFALALAGSVIFSPLVGILKRRLLLIIGHAGMCVAFIVGYAAWLSNVTVTVRIVALCLYVFIFQLGPGLLVWIITFEIFPPNASGAAQGICTGANWVANTLVYILYPIIDGEINFHVSGIFIGLNFLICIFMGFAVVETYRKTPEVVLDAYEKKFKKLN